jgi:type IV secretion system protein VirD4
MKNLRELTGWSMLVIDTKGELAAETAYYRSQHGECIFLNPYSLFGFPSHGFNPITALNTKDVNFADDAMGLAEAMIKVQGNDPHWPESAQDLVACGIMYAALQDDPRQRNLAFVRECLGQPAIEFRETARAMRHVGTMNDWDELGVKAGRFMDIDPKNEELNSVLSTALTQTRWLDSRLIKEDLSKGSIDFLAMRQRPITIYLMLPADKLVTQAVWLRIIITSCLQKLLRDIQPGPVPLMLMLDEFANLGHLPMIENTQALMRGYGVKMWSVLQDLPQLKAVYNNDRWESFIANSGVLQAFAPQDATTAEYLSKLSGQRTAVTLSSSGDNVTESQVSQPVMYPQEFRNMDPGFSTIFCHKVKGVVRAFAPYR